MTINDITMFLESRDLSQFLLPFKIVALTISAIFIYAIVYYNIKDGTIIKDVRRRTMDFLSFQRYAPPKSFSSRAKEISALLDNKKYKKAIFQTEVLFSELLKRFDYKGNTLLEMIEDPDTPNRDSLKRLAEIAIEMREKPGYLPELDELDKLYSTFEDSLIKFGVITDDVQG